MFDFHDVEQNTDEWYQLRGGKLTSSNLGKIMANYGKAFGEPAKKYAVDIAIEQITGQAIASNYTNEHMQRGHEQEPIARMLYEQETFCDVSNGGFFGSDFVGCSPDGLVSEDGVVEIKCVIGSVMFSNIKRMNVDPAYKWQCIGNVKFTGRKWIDFVSYCADFPEANRLFIYRLNAGDLEDEFKMIDSRIAEFKLLVCETKSKILDTNYINQG
ncbi:MAG: YqaJ-like viral recombinase [Bacteroidetes bacterium]|nr:MAG: YqaJ-like viral recombinase [Bacteroidota bacterium]